MNLFLPAYFLQAVATGSDSNVPAITLMCAAMTIGLLFYTFYFPGEITEARDKGRLAFLRERKDTVYENLRDLNFEYKAGKFPESDYQEMRGALEEEAAAVLAEIERLESGAGDVNVSSPLSSGKSRGRKGARS